MQRSDPSLDPLTSELQLGGASPFRWIIVAALVAGLGVSAAVGWVKFALPSTAQARRAKAIAELSAGQKEFEAFAHTARAQAAWKSAAASINRLQEEHALALAAARELEKMLTSLLDSEDGRQIAARPDMIAKYIALRDHKRISTSELEALSDSLNKLLEISERALADETLLIDVDATLVAQIKEIESQYQQLYDVRRDLALLRFLEEQSRSNAPTAVSLAAIVAAWERAQAESDLAELAPPGPVPLRMEPAEESLEAMLNEATTEKEKAIVRRSQQILATVQASYTLDSEFQAALPEIRSLLAPMISYGNRHLEVEDDLTYGWVDGGRAECPVSLTQIKRLGVLAPGKETSLGRLICLSFSTGGRPFGSFPRHVADDNGEFKRAQELLTKFGDLMVEQGLLIP